MTYLYSNNAATTLAAAIDDTVTTLTVLDAALFPSGATVDDPFKVTLQDVDTGAIEICDCTNLSGNVLTVIRGQESTASISFPIGALVHHRLTAENLNNFVQDLENVGTGIGEIAHSRVGPTANFKTIKGGLNTTVENAATEVVIDSSDTASGSNLGATAGRQGLYVDNTGTQLNLKSLVGGADIGITADGEEITVAYNGTPGEANTGANVGIGDAEVYRDTAAGVLNFKRLVEGDNVTLTNDADTVTIDASGGLGNIPTGVFNGGIVTINSGDNSAVDVTAGSGIIVDAYTDPENPVYTPVSWNAATAVSVAGAGGDAVVISVLSNGTIDVTYGRSFYNHIVTRDRIDLALASYENSVLKTVIPYKSVLNNNIHALFEYLQASKAAAFYVDNANNHQWFYPRQLNLWFVADSTLYNGMFFTLGSGFDGGVGPRPSPPQPPTITGAYNRFWRVSHPGSGLELTYWGYVDQDSTLYAPGFVTDVANYDFNGTVTPIGGPATAASIQLLWHAPGVGEYMEYCQSWWDTLDEACAALPDYLNGPTNVRRTPGITEGWILLGALVVRKDATTLEDISAARIYTYQNGVFVPPHVPADLSLDGSPTLGSDLDLNGYDILITNSTDGVEGAIGLAQDDTSVFFAHVDSARTYDPSDGGILCSPGVLSLYGSVVTIPALEDATVESRDLQISSDGVIFAAPLPVPGWEVSDTSTFNHSFGTGKTTGPWVEVQDLEVNFGDDVTAGDRVDVYVELYVENTEDKPGVIEIGVGINGATPTVVGANKSIGPESITYIPVAWSFITATDYTTADRIDVFARRGASQDDATLHLRGTTSEHTQIVSIPGTGGGGGGSPTNLGNIPAASSVTITSSTGANTVLAGATTGPNGAGVMTEAQVTSLNSKVDTGSSLGTGQGTVFGGKVGTDLQFKSLRQGSNVTITEDANEITINSTGGGGGIPEPADANYGYLREGGGSPAWVRGARVFEAATDPGGQSVGDFTFVTG